MELKELEHTLSDFQGTGPEVVSLQPISIVDHVLTCGNPDLVKTLIHDELGGSHRVSLEEIQRILSAVGEYYSKAGGSASNVMRGLAGFGVRSKLVGARGTDEWGALFNSSMRRAGVNVDDILPKEGRTGRCCILSCEGNRTMRTCLDGAARTDPDELTVNHFASSSYTFLSGYCLYTPGLLERAVDLALAVGSKIALDLASFEIVRAFRPQLTAVITSGAISLCFCNEDEASEWADIVGATSSSNNSPEQGLAMLAEHCDIAVVTLGEKGCLVQYKRGGDDDRDDDGADDGNANNNVIAQPACSGVKVVDTTGAGDLFASGFMFSLLRGYSIRRAAEIGCLAGAAVVQTLGAEMGPINWHWLHQRLHGELAAETVRSSAVAVQQELLACYALIERKKRGVVYYGSARLRESSEQWERARKLGAAVAALLGVTTWTGGGPGMMEAATRGAMDVGCEVAGVRIGKEAGTTVRTASYLPADSSVMCRFLSSRKVALVDSGVRMKVEDRTAFLFLPGGLGTMDELFEILCLMQLRKLGTRFPVPVVICNFAESGARGRGFYDGLLEFLASCVDKGTVGRPELHDVLVAADEGEVLSGLAQFYGLEREGGDAENGGGGDVKLMRASSWVEARLNKQSRNSDGGHQG